MNGQPKIIIILCAAFAVVFSNSAGAAVELTGAEIDRLKAGKLVKHPLAGSGKESVVGGSSFALIDAPPEVVWKASTDVGAWPHIYPYTYSAQEMASKDNATAVKLSLGVSLLKANVYLTMVTKPEVFELSTQLNKKKSSYLAQDVRSSMKLLPQPGGKTLVVYSCLTKATFGPIVAVLGRRAINDMENVLLRLPRSLKMWVEGPNGAKYR